jgi:hypothetical protein
MTPKEKRNPIERWTVTDYEILSVAPTDRFEAVYLIDDAIEVSPVDAIAAVKVIERRLARPPGSPRGTSGEEVSRDEYNDVVGIELDGSGSFVVSNEASNFLGLVRKGEDPNSLRPFVPETFPK